MLMKNGVKDTRLFLAGAGLCALRSIIQPILDRTHRSTDATDFAMGLLLGVGLGLLILFVWKLGKRNRGQPNGLGLG